MVKIEVLPPDETNAAKPGWQTSEFWLNIIAIIASVLSQTVPTDSTIGRIIAALMPILAALGYTVSRSSVKKQQLKFNAEFNRLALTTEAHRLS